jgi:AraC-like DNA-binding protein
LLAGPSTLAVIAEAVGYGSEAAFSRAFKKSVGVAPTTWRVNARGFGSISGATEGATDGKRSLSEAAHARRATGRRTCGHELD